MTSFKVPNKALIILKEKENCLKLLHTNGSRVTYWRLPTYIRSEEHQRRFEVIKDWSFLKERRVQLAEGEYTEF